MTYVYRCRACGQRFEAEQRMQEPSLTEHTCADGAVGAVHRVPQAFGVSYRCLGFYSTDYPRAGAQFQARVED